LIFLGDYVDGWSQSPQVIDCLIELGAKQECVFIRGNHDELLREWLLGKENELWLQHGGKATISAYENIDAEQKSQHISFLNNLQNYFIDSHNRLFVHAGFTNLHGIAYEYYPKLVYWDRTLWELALAVDKKLNPDDAYYPKRLTIYDEIYIGHTPVTKINKTTPVQMTSVWNIDTGAAFRGRLSILDVDTKDFWQSDPLPELYPNEQGRN
jgi:serine/threonine protein phosphatase 1